MSRGYPVRLGDQTILPVVAGRRNAARRTSCHRTSVTLTGPRMVAMLTDNRVETGQKQPTDSASAHLCPEQRTSAFHGGVGQVRRRNPADLGYGRLGDSFKGPDRTWHVG